MSISDTSAPQHLSPPGDHSPDQPPPAPDIEFLRRLHGSTQAWYSIAETKAQLLLAFNGAFITVLTGATFGKISEVHTLVQVFGAETWALLAIALTAPVAAAICAVGCLWSQHSKSRQELSALAVDPDDPTTYQPAILWYFAHLAQLPVGSAVKRLRHVDIHQCGLGLQRDSAPGDHGNRGERSRPGVRTTGGPAPAGNPLPT